MEDSVRKMLSRLWEDLKRMERKLREVDSGSDTEEGLARASSYGCFKELERTREDLRQLILLLQQEQ